MLNGSPSHPGVAGLVRLHTPARPPGPLGLVKPAGGAATTIINNPSGPGGRAVVCNVTNPATPGCLGEPFKITSDDGTGTLVPTVLEIHLTGVRNSPPAAITATIGTTAILATRNIVTDPPGFDEIDIILPATVNTGPNLTLVV